MENQHEEEETIAEKVSRIGNVGVGPNSYQFLCSIFTDGAMSRAELFRKRQRLDTLLTATPEQLKGMKIEITELKLIFNFCEARVTQTWNRMDPHFAKVEKFVALHITEPSLSALCKFVKNEVKQFRHNITRVHEAFPAKEVTAALFQVAPRAALEEKCTAPLVQRLQMLNNLIKYTNDRTEYFF